MTALSSNTQARPISGAELGSIQSYYDTGMNRPLMLDYYGQSDFFNFGYWYEHTSHPKQASENLMEQLLGFIPHKHGSMLDIACGRGATTRYLLNYYPAADVTGINISLNQLARARQNAPDCTFLLMDATKLAFPSNHFDNMICVEAAFHFNTREEFLREAHRVLAPGGSLVLSDMLAHTWSARLARRVPRQNFVADVQSYREVYGRAGFEEVQVVDATTECWHRFRRNVARWAGQKFMGGQLNAKHLLRGALGVVLTAPITHYLLVAARKGSSS
jgi:ubiquinone/menaquinone biosynthesis C-methylase UbiE